MRLLRKLSHAHSQKARSAGPRVVALLSAAACALCLPGAAHGADRTWDNGAGNLLWDTSSVNWSGAAWNNAAGDGAIFGATGVGTIDVVEPISLDSFNFTADGFTLDGAGSLSIMAGSSTQTTGVVNVAPGATAKIKVPVSSGFGFQKIGTGTLELSAPCAFGGGIPLTGNGLLRADLLVGGTSGPIASGALRLMNSSVVPAATRASIANGYLDIGANNVTLSELIFVNQTVGAPWNPAINAAGNGVIGSGTLRVTGDINVIGVTGGNQGSNTIGTNFDIGGGTQVVRVGVNSSFGLSNALQFAGTISNGSLLKSVGVTQAGVQGSIDGMGLFGNNTYSGSTRLNSGTTVITGTNATTMLEIAGIGGPGGSQCVLQGANGSLQSATLIQAIGNGTFVIDNNAAMGASGNNQPNIPAAQNNDRIRDDAELRLRDGAFVYRGQAGAAASEALGNLNVLGGHNTVTLTPNGGGSATVTVNNNLSLASRATMQISSTTLSAASKMFVNGTLPAADATGILPRIVGSSDFLTYNGATGMTPYTGYATDINTPGANVAVTAASTVTSSVNINALKRTGSFTTTINAGQALGITSGMILNTSGTGTYTGGTIAFGSNPGAFFSGTNVINSALTGSAGLINANSTVTLNGDLSGLSGTITTCNGTTTMATNTFAGDIEVRSGQLTLSTSQTLAGQGPIRIGVPEMDADLFGTIPTISFSSAGANAVIGRDIICDGGSQTAAGAELSFSYVPGLSPLSNNTGSQTLSGNITLNSPLRLQGGGGGGSGSTNFTGNVSGPAMFVIPNGRANFSGNVSNDGGFLIGRQGFSAKITFSGTGSGHGPIRVSGGNSMSVSYESGALSTGTITVFNADGFTPVSLIPLENSTIGNTIAINGNAIANVGAGITAEWAGPLTGAAPLSKTGPGTLVLSSSASTFGGTLSIGEGTVAVNAAMPSFATTVASGATLKGSGALAGSVSVSAGGILAPGNSIGTFGTGHLSLAGIFREEIDLSTVLAPLADLLNVTGAVSLSNAVLDLSVLNAPPVFPTRTILLVANDGSDAAAGVFGTINGVPLNYTAFIDYAFSGVDSLGRVGDGNDIALTLFPEPTGLVLLGLLAAVQFARRRPR